MQTSKKTPPPAAEKRAVKFIGIDFGTSNSLAALVKNDRAEFVIFPDGNISTPTLIYFPARSKETFIGTESVRRYLHDLEETGSAGRLMLSIKTLLPDAKFDYTTVAGHGRFSAEDLAAKFIAALKTAAERQFGEEFRGVVLGRPVNFTDLAVERLEKAARGAGFEEVVFWLEPVAAAIAYEATATADETICVVDIGGGTTDVCVIETSAARSLSPDRLTDIKAVGGVYQAGDELSARIMHRKLGPRFGAGSTFQSLGKTLPFPVHLTHKITKWHRINLLNNAADKETIRTIVPYSDRPQDVQRLLDLITRNYGFELFGVIDQAKKRLTDHDQAIIKFNPLELREEISVAEFENYISAVVREIENSVLECLAAANVAPADISRVILTGGTSQVPLISRAVGKIFGEAKILRPDYFSSVATGLGYIAATFTERARAARS